MYKSVFKNQKQDYIKHHWVFEQTVKLIHLFIIKILIVVKSINQFFWKKVNFITLFCTKPSPCLKPFNRFIAKTLPQPSLNWYSQWQYFRVGVCKSSIKTIKRKTKPFLCNDLIVLLLYVGHPWMSICLTSLNRHKLSCFQVHSLNTGQNNGSVCNVTIKKRIYIDMHTDSKEQNIRFRKQVTGPAVLCTVWGVVWRKACDRLVNTSDWVFFSWEAVSLLTLLR